jgi:hypothetical protein
MKRPVFPAQLDRFFSIYTRHLERCVRDRPDDYRYPVEKVPEVASRMRNGVEAGRASIEGPAFRATCKELGIKQTYKAIYEFLGTPAAATNPTPDTVIDEGLTPAA